MKLKYLFYSEVIINIPSFIMCLFLPKLFLDQLTQLASTTITNDLIRWYGVILFVLTIILAKALYEKDLSALKTIFFGYAIGDIMQIVVTAIMARNIGGWNFALIFTAIYSVILCTGRILAIKNTDRLGFAN